MLYSRITAIGLFLSLVSFSQSALAQPVGTFRWQLQPFCNVLTVNVVQQSGLYTLDGTDDLCGATQAASVVGIASLNSNGTVGFGLTLVLPGGTPVHIEARINMSSLSGTWRDSAGNNGTLIFTPGAAVAGSPRPSPTGGLAPASVTNVQIANNAVSSANIIDRSITNIDILDGPRAAIAGDQQVLTLTLTPQVVRSVTINAPTAGRVIVNASGYWFFASNTVAEAARCSITPGTTLDSAALMIGAETGAAAISSMPFGGTRGFTVNAGNNTFNLVCDVFAGAVALQDSYMTALFVANTQ